MLRTLLMLAALFSLIAEPLLHAIRRLSGKSPIAAELKSADWEAVPVALSDRAFFTATITEMEFLDTAAQQIRDAVGMTRRTLADGSTGAFQTREKFVAELQSIAERKGLAPADPALQGTIADVTTPARLEMIYDINTRSAQEFGRWKMEQNAAVLNAYPAQELVRIAERDVPRGFRRGAEGALVVKPGDSWPERWVTAGGTLVQGRMVALKSDPVWHEISRFSVPWPPFDFNSGYGLEDVDRAAAEALGLLGPDDVVEPQTEAFNARMQASVSNLSPRAQQSLKAIFGDQVEITDGVAQWRGKAAA